MVNMSTLNSNDQSSNLALVLSFILYIVGKEQELMRRGREWTILKTAVPMVYNKYLLSTG